MKNAIQVKTVPRISNSHMNLMPNNTHIEEIVPEMIIMVFKLVDQFHTVLKLVWALKLNFIYQSAYNNLFRIREKDIMGRDG